MSAERNNSDLNIQFKSLYTIYYSLIFGMISFFVVILFINEGRAIVLNDELDFVFTIVVPVFGLIMMFSSRMIYNQLISKSYSNKDLPQKIAIYKSSKIITWVLVEIACLLSLVALMLTSNYLYFVVYIFLLGYFYLLRPSKESLVKDLRLNSKESDLIRGK